MITECGATINIFGESILDIPGEQETVNCYSLPSLNFHRDILNGCIPGGSCLHHIEGTGEAIQLPDGYF